VEPECRNSTNHRIVEVWTCLWDTQRTSLTACSKRITYKVTLLVFKCLLKDLLHRLALISRWPSIDAFTVQSMTALIVKHWYVPRTRTSIGAWISYLEWLATWIPLYELIFSEIHEQKQDIFDVYLVTFGLWRRLANLFHVNELNDWLIEMMTYYTNILLIDSLLWIRYQRCLQAFWLLKMI